MGLNVQGMYSELMPVRENGEGATGGCESHLAVKLTLHEGEKEGRKILWPSLRLWCNSTEFGRAAFESPQVQSSSCQLCHPSMYWFPSFPVPDPHFYLLGYRSK